MADDSPRRPVPRLAMVPMDQTTAVGPTGLQVIVDNGGEAVGAPLLDAIATRIRLVTWPENAPVSMSTVAQDFEPRRENGNQVYGTAIIRVTPRSPLEERWYFLHLGEVPRGVEAAGGVQLTKVSDGRPGARFAVGSDPRMTWLHRCMSGPMAAKVLVDFSENVRIAAERSVSIGSSGSCHLTVVLGDAREMKTVAFYCDGLDPTRPLTVLADTTVVGTTGRPVRGAGSPIEVPPRAFRSLGSLGGCDSGPLTEPE